MNKQQTWAGRIFRRPVSRIYLSATLCFLAINVTNDRILRELLRHGRIYGNDPSLSVNIEKTTRFFLLPIKSFVFFVCTAVLITPFGPFLKRGCEVLRQQGWIRSLAPALICLALTCTVLPVSFGRSYAKMSTDPFNQVPDQTYRRLLIPGLANLYHLDGFLYTFFCWILVFAAIVALRMYFIDRGQPLSMLQETSLLTVGAFATAYQTPGYPDIVIVLLGLIALMEFHRDGYFSFKQLAAFSLALMAHEAGAVIVFAPMILFLFGRGAWIPSGIIGSVYALTLLANFSFHISLPLALQTTVSGMSAGEFFRRWPMNVVIGALFSFKALWLVVPVALNFLFRTDRRAALFVLSGFALAFASTYIGIDYSRLIGFATFRW